MTIVVQHCFGKPGTGGPIIAMGRVLKSSLSTKYRFVPMIQEEAAGGINSGLIRRFVRLLSDVRPDMIHVRGLGNEGFHGVLAARIAKVPRILISIHGTIRDLPSHTNLVRKLFLQHFVERSSLMMATHIFTVCEATAARPFLHPFRDKLVGVVPNGVHLPQQVNPDIRYETRRELGIASNAIVGIVVSRITRAKGTDVLARALQALQLPSDLPVHVLWVGDGPDRVELERALANQRHVRFHLLGLRHDVPRFLQASDLYLSPSYYENLSNALLEAMSYSLPVIACAVGGNVEIINRGGGLMTPAGDPTAFGSAFAELCSSAARRRELGLQAYRNVSKHYTIDHMLNGLDRIYQRALGTAESIR